MSMVSTVATAMTRMTGEKNASVSETATDEKISAGVATWKAMRFNCRRASPGPITPLCASHHPAAMTVKMMAKPVRTSSMPAV